MILELHNTILKTVSWTDSDAVTYCTLMMVE